MNLHLTGLAPDPSHRNLSPADSADLVVRAMADDGSFRVVALHASDTVQGAVWAQRLSGETACRLGELLLATILIRETMSPAQRVQTVIGGHGSVAADAWPGGMTRGLARLAEDGVMALSTGARMQVMRARYDGGLQQGLLAVDPMRGIQGALEDYMRLSEQVESWLALRCEVEGDIVLAAGGYLVQRLPEAHQAQIDAMAAHHDALDALGEGWRGDPDPDKLLGRLLGEILWHRLEGTKIFFGCNCGEERLLGSLATLGRADLQEMIDDGEALSITCDYCAETYTIGVQRLRALLETQ